MKTIILKNNELKAVSIGVGLAAVYLILAIMITAYVKRAHDNRNQGDKYRKDRPGIYSLFERSGTKRETINTLNNYKTLFYEN